MENLQPAANQKLRATPRDLSPTRRNWDITRRQSLPLLGYRLAFWIFSRRLRFLISPHPDSGRAVHPRGCSPCFSNYSARPQVVRWGHFCIPHLQFAVGESHPEPLFGFQQKRRRFAPKDAPRSSTSSNATNRFAASGTFYSAYGADPISDKCKVGWRPVPPARKKLGRRELRRGPIYIRNEISSAPPHLRHIFYHKFLLQPEYASE